MELLSKPLPKPRTWHLLLVVGLFLGLVFLAFGRSLSQGFAPLDDGFLVVGNLATRGFTSESLRLAFTTYDPELYIPLTLVSFQFNYLLTGLATWSYHLVNLLLHAGNALLLAWLLFRMTGRKTPAILAGLLFATHPLLTEAVVWITARKDLLSTFFALLSFHAYVSYREGSRSAYVLSLGAFLLSLLSMVLTATLPIIYVLFDMLLEGRKARRSIVDKIPFLLLSLSLGIVALGGKGRVLAATTPWETALLAAKSIMFYVQKFLLPFNLSVFYPQRGIIAVTKLEFLIPLLLLFAAIAWMVRTWRTSRRATFGLLLFLVALAPALLNFQRGTGVFFASDRYAYFPSIGLIFLVALFLTTLEDRGILRTSGRFVVGCVIGTFVLLSLRQTRLWDSSEKLFGNALALYPQASEARRALADIKRKQKQPQEAFDLLKEGLSYGDDILLRMGAGYIYAETRNIADAKEQLEIAQRIDPKNPEPVYALGQLAEQTGDPVTAREEYAAAVILDPSYVVARVGLARLMRAAKEFPTAEEQLQEALRWNQSSVDAHLEYARLLIDEGKKEEAKMHIQTVLRIDPESEAAAWIVEE